MPASTGGLEDAEVRSADKDLSGCGVNATARLAWAQPEARVNNVLS